MLFAEFKSLVNFNTRTNDSTFDPTEMLLLANVHKDEIAQRIKKVNGDYFGGVLTRALEADRREYPLPADLLSSIERVEAMIDGVNWEIIDQVDLPLMDTTNDEASIRANFAGQKSKYDRFRGSLFLYSEKPIIAVSGGLKLWAPLYPTKFDNLTDNRDMSVPKDEFSIGFPREFHELLARRVGISWKQRQEIPVPLTETELKYEADLATTLSWIEVAEEALACIVPVDNWYDY